MEEVESRKPASLLYTIVARTLIMTPSGHRHIAYFLQPHVATLKQ